MSNPLEQAIFDYRNKEMSHTAFARAFAENEILVLCTNEPAEDGSANVQHVMLNDQEMFAIFTSDDEATKFARQNNQARQFIKMTGEDILALIPNHVGMIVNPGSDPEVQINAQAAQHLKKKALMDETEMAAIQGETNNLEKAIVDGFNGQLSANDFLKVLFNSKILIASKSEITREGDSYSYDPLRIFKKDDGVPRIVVCTDEAALTRFCTEHQLDANYIEAAASSFILALPPEHGLCVIGKSQAMDVPPEHIQSLIKSINPAI